MQPLDAHKSMAANGFGITEKDTTNGGDCRDNRSEFSSHRLSISEGNISTDVLDLFITFSAFKYYSPSSTIRHQPAIRVVTRLHQIATRPSPQYRHPCRLVAPRICTQLSWQFKHNRSASKKQTVCCIEKRKATQQLKDQRLFNSNRFERQPRGMPTKVWKSIRPILGRLQTKPIIVGRNPKTIHQPKPNPSMKFDREPSNRSHCHRAS